MFQSDGITIQCCDTMLSSQSGFISAQALPRVELRPKKLSFVCLLPWCRNQGKRFGAARKDKKGNQ